MMPAQNTTQREGGFVLGFVILMLFAISVMSATGYLVVSNEFSMSKHASESSEAVAVARAGLERFVAEQIGVVGDSVSYAIGDGIALVTTTRLSARDSLTDVYYVQSEASVSDVFTTNAPTQRTVGAYALHHRRPLAHHAQMLISEREIEVESSFWGYGQVHGIDSSTVADCPGGGATSITAAIALNQVDERSLVNGAPDSEIWANYQAMYDSIALRWDVLQDPDFPVEFEDQMPNFAALPADSFPVIRYNGNQYFSNSHDGRGLLIVTGEYDAWTSFDWEGIILAGSVDYRIYGDIRGMLVGGLDRANPGSKVEVRGGNFYYSCNVYAANESLSYLSLIENSVFEVN